MLPLDIIIVVKLFKKQADQSNLRVHLRCVWGGLMINEVDEGLPRTKTNEPEITSLANGRP